MPNDYVGQLFMSTDRTTEQRVVAAVISRHAGLLVCRRPLHKRHGGLWEFPGGKCEPGETDVSTLRRELREELAVDVKQVGHEEFSVHDDGSDYLIVFRPVTIEGEPQCHEHVELTWRPAIELLQLPLAPSDRKFVQSLLLRDGQTPKA